MWVRLTSGSERTANNGRMSMRAKKTEETEAKTEAKRGQIIISISYFTQYVLLYSITNPLIQASVLVSAVRGRRRKMELISK